jgi:hypothetical protein
MLCGEKMGEGGAGDSLGAGVVVQGADEEEVSEGGATEWSGWRGWRGWWRGWWRRMIVVTGAEGVIICIRVEAVAVVGYECTPWEELYAVTKRGPATVRQESLDEGRGGPWENGGNSCPRMMMGVVGEGGILLPKQERHVMGEKRGRGD